jgi:hypothetical protein
MTFEEMEKALANATLTSLAQAPATKSVSKSHESVLLKTVSAMTHVIDRIELQIGELQKRVTELESAQGEMRYVGTWAEGKTYSPGSFATHSGALWHCNRKTMEKPGNGNADWTMAAKSGLPVAHTPRSDTAPAHARNGSAGEPARPRSP